MERGGLDLNIGRRRKGDFLGGKVGGNNLWEEVDWV